MLVNTLRDTPYRGPSPLAAYHSADGRSYGILAPVDKERLERNRVELACLDATSLAVIARANNIDARSFAAFLSAHSERSETQCILNLPPLLESRALAELPGASTRAAFRSDAELSARAVARLLARERQFFSASDFADDLAIESLLLGRASVKLAIASAAARGESQPERLDRHHLLLPGSSKTNAEHAMWVLARVRLSWSQWPVASGFSITSPFGERMHPVLGTKKFHNGVDIGVPIGTSLHAILDGQVLRASYDNVSGHYLRMSHGYGIESVYCHLSQATRAVGNQFNQGEVVAQSGNTGRSTGPHLHYTVRLFGQPVDPLLFRTVAQR
jgi:murein DD-endopeptidase MepM/ murein hydrolase activator NlpD